MSLYYEPNLLLLIGLVQASRQNLVYRLRGRKRLAAHPPGPKQQEHQARVGQLFWTVTHRRKDESLRKVGRHKNYRRLCYQAPRSEHSLLKGCQPRDKGTKALVPYKFLGTNYLQKSKESRRQDPFLPSSFVPNKLCFFYFKGDSFLGDFRVRLFVVHSTDVHLSARNSAFSQGHCTP